MKYWLFLVMPWFGPELWKRMIEGGIAAQHYDEDIPLCKQNITMLRRMKKGDGIIAAFKKHRFAGYGRRISVNNLAQRIVRLTGSSSPIVHQSERPGDMKHTGGPFFLEC